jgi:SAM-dependent methyltransferase
MTDKRVQASCFDEYVKRHGEYRIYTEQAIAKMLGKISPRRDDLVLDLGCGTGYVGMHALGKWVGLDISFASAKRANENLFCAVCGDAMHLPFRDGSFDKVVCLGILHHLPESIHQIALEVKRVLHDRGMVHIFEPNASNPSTFLIHHPKSPFREAITPNERALTASEIIEPFEDMSFSILVCEVEDIPLVKDSIIRRLMRRARSIRSLINGVVLGMVYFITHKFSPKNSIYICGIKGQRQAP